MYVPGIDKPAWQWLWNFAVFLVVLFAFSAVLPLLTGLACGWRYAEHFHSVWPDDWPDCRGL